MQTHRRDIEEMLQSAVQKQPIVDMHTHLYPPTFGTPMGGRSGKSDRWRRPAAATAVPATPSIYADRRRRPLRGGGRGGGGLGRALAARCDEGGAEFRVAITK